jgi:hypothetical protein
MFASCVGDVEVMPIETENLQGYVSKGEIMGLYGDARLKMTADSLIMVDLPINRLTSALSKVKDTTFETEKSMMDFYNIIIANKGNLPESEFVDSVIVQLTALELMK